MNLKVNTIVWISILRTIFVNFAIFFTSLSSYASEFKQPERVSFCAEALANKSHLLVGPGDFSLDFINEKHLSFVVPNEDQPKNLLPFLKGLPSGAYLSVGTERSFIAAGLTEGLTDLIVTDIDPKVILYVYINTVLLKAAEDRQQYLKMRQAKTIGELTGLSSRVLDSDNKNLFVKTWLWWARVQDHSGMRALYETPSSSPEGKFQNANYLFYEDQFQRVQLLAKEEKIQTFLVDLGEREVMIQLKKWLDKKDIKISAIDLSNAWSYMVSEKMYESLSIIGDASSPGAIVIGTNPLSALEDDSIGLGIKGDWYYTALKLRDYFSTPWLFEKLLRPSRRYIRQRVHQSPNMDYSF
jgi:hypothetical protein